MQACKGPGKVNPSSMMIYTPRGMVRWGDLKSGDFVFAEDGSPSKIINCYDNGIVDFYKMTFDDGSSCLSGLEHLWKVRGRTERRHGVWSVLTTGEIIDRGVREKNGKWAGRHFEIPRQGPAQFPRKEQPLDPYLTGIWLGDGSKDAPSYCKPYLEVEQEINHRGYKTSRHADGKQVRILDCVNEFKALECFGLGSHERFIPDNYKTGDIQQRSDLVKGLMDADGCIGDDGHMEYSTTSKYLADDVVWMVRSLGGVAYIKAAIKKGWYRAPDGEKVECRDCYRVTVTLPFNPFLISHKAERWKDPMRSPSTMRYMTRKIDKIELESREHGMCIEIDHPSKCYLANDFIVTHNTCVLAWIAWNFLLTRPNPKCAATSISGDNLADNFWTEMAKWQSRSPLLKSMFTWTKTRIFANDSPEEWWMSARTWPKTGDANRQSDTLAGLHADYILFILDETGSMPEAVMVSAEAALSSCVEGHIVQAGNPTTLSGPLYRASKVERHLWFVVEITGDPDDPNRAPRMKIEWCKQQIESYGRNNAYVRVNVFGQFPESSLNALIGPDEVEEAMKRFYREFQIGPVPKIMGVDVARFGDDYSVISRREGIQAYPLLKYRNLDSVQGATTVNREWMKWDADAAFVDGTGGFGAGWVDQLRVLGKSPMDVHFNAQAHEKDKYYNKRAEMTFDLVAWIKRGGALPEDANLKKQLTETTYTHQGDRLILEPKEIIKARLGFSPDEMDALMLTFAEPVTMRQRLARGRHTSNFDVFGGMDKASSNGYNASYDPFSQL